MMPMSQESVEQPCKRRIWHRMMCSTEHPGEVLDELVQAMSGLHVRHYTVWILHVLKSFEKQLLINNVVSFVTAS